MRKLLQGSANLEFWETYNAEEIIPYLQQLDSRLANGETTETTDSTATETKAKPAEKPAKFKIKNADKNDVAKTSNAQMEAAKKQHPLLAMLPESVRGTASKVAEAVQTGVRMYRAAEREIGQVQTLISRARGLKNDPAAAFGILGDALNLGSSALGRLGALPEAGRRFGNLTGAAEMLAYAGQASRHLAERSGVEGGSIGGWIDAAAGLVDSASDSLNNGARGVQSLTAYLAARKDGT